MEDLQKLPTLPRIPSSLNYPEFLTRKRVLGSKYYSDVTTDRVSAN